MTRFWVGPAFCSEELSTFEEDTRPLGKFGQGEAIPFAENISASFPVHAMAKRLVKQNETNLFWSLVSGSSMRWYDMSETSEDL